jgi:hypothetical protein
MSALRNDWAENLHLGISCVWSPHLCTSEHSDWERLGRCRDLKCWALGLVKGKVLCSTGMLQNVIKGLKLSEFFGFPKGGNFLACSVTISFSVVTVFHGIISPIAVWGACTKPVGFLKHYITLLVDVLLGCDAVYLPTNPHGMTTHKYNIHIYSPMRTSNLTSCY